MPWHRRSDLFGRGIGWLSGKRYIPQQKSPIGMETVYASQIVSRDPLPAHKRGNFLYPKKTVFREIRPLSGNFSGMWNHLSRASTWTCVRGKFGGNRSKKSGRSGVSYTSQKNNASATHFFALSPKAIARFRWKRARLSRSGLNPTCQVSSKSIQVSEIY